jgi:hypothetical protein
VRPGLALVAAGVLALGQAPSKPGEVQIFATKLPDRLHVGVLDPAGIVDRVDVYFEKEGERTRLRRLEDVGPDRMEYALDPALTTSGRIAIEAISTRTGKEVVLKRMELAGEEESAVPAKPDLKILEKHVARHEVVEAPPARTDTGSPVPWWIIAGGILAAAFVGAAIWQETR